MNAIKETNLEYFHIFSTTPIVDFKSPNSKKDVAALNTLKRAKESLLILSQPLNL